MSITRVAFVVFLFFLANITETLKAQTFLTLKAGASLSTVKVVYPSNEPFGYTSGYWEKNATGLAGGVSLELRLFDSLYLEPEVGYLQCGSKNIFTSDLQRLEYITFPLSLSYRASRNLKVFFGGYASYLVAGSNFSDVLQYTKRGDAGLQLGMEVMVYKNIGMGVRYFYGLVDIDTDEGNHGWFVYEAYNRSLQSYLFYSLPLTRKRNE